MGRPQSEPRRTGGSRAEDGHAGLRMGTRRPAVMGWGREVVGAPQPCAGWKKKVIIIKNLIMHLANLSLGRVGKEADNWFAEQCHYLLL